MTITALPSAPLPTDNTATFNSKAFALVAALNGFVTEANALGAGANADAVTAAVKALEAINAQAAAAGAANFKGAWSGLSGALAIPASVSHLSKVWVLTESVSNVAAEVPGTSSKWLALSVNFDSPGVIGGVTPDIGNFTTIFASGLIFANNGVKVGPTANPSFSAYNNATQTITSAFTTTKLIFNIEDFDTNGNFNTSNSRFTPTVAGYYQVNASMNFNNAYTGGAAVFIYKNTSTLLVQSGVYCNGDYLAQPACACLVYMNGTTDFVEAFCQVQTTSGATLTSNTGRFSASMVRSAS